MYKMIIAAIAALAAFPSALLAGDYSLESPDRALRLEISVGEGVSYSLYSGETLLLCPSHLSMTLTNGVVFGGGDRLRRATRHSVDQIVDSPLYKSAEVHESYNELILSFQLYDIVFRAYDEGVAYRFKSKMKEEFQVASESAGFSFPADWDVYVPYVRGKDKNSQMGQFYNSFENLYSHHSLSSWEEDRLAFLPLVVETPGGMKICITESDLLNYPGMYLLGDGGNELHGVWSPLPAEKEFSGRRMLYYNVDKWEDYLAVASASETFPWRVVAVAADDKNLLENNMVWLLATPSEGDYSWVRGGKVAWDWWNAWNLYGVDFESGINNDTYKYYIDFAASKGIEYVVLDEGWYDEDGDLLHIVPEIDLPMLLTYAKDKDVGIILWVGYHSLETKLDEVVEHYAQMGVKGFKVDFFNADDQKTIHDQTRIATKCAEYGMILDYHGVSKPTGLQRTYPNVLNFEGVFGLEQAKWMNVNTDQVAYDVTIPFIRNLAGPMDYTQGAMRNATRKNYRSVNSEAMSQGTRCRQLAEYVVFTSPLSMLCDSPSNYLCEPECTDFISSVPVVWDETVALDGIISKYVAVARRSGDSWYIGAMTDWDARELTLDLNTIGAAGKEISVYRDGVNADKAARDYKHETISIPADGLLTITMAPGGGWVGVLE